MKIKLHSKEGGTWVLVGFVAVMVIIVAGMGGCAAYKLMKIKQRQDQRQATNDLYELTNVFNGDINLPTNGTVIAIASVLPVYSNGTFEFTLETSTNLSDWETVVEDVEAADADVTLAGALNNNSNEPARFFRLMQR